jgi:hypothetical protein
MAAGFLAVVAGCLILVTRSSHASDEPTMDHLSAPLASALSSWKDERPNECPTLGILESEGFMEPNTPRDDPWGGTFRVDCSKGQLSLLSAGPDRRLGTTDDVHVRLR